MGQGQLTAKLSFRLFTICTDERIQKEVRLDGEDHASAH